MKQVLLTLSCSDVAPDYMKQLVLHLGFQKTGSTSIQALLDMNRARLEDLDLYVYGPDTMPARSPALSAIRNPTPQALAIAKYVFMGIFREMLESQNETAIFSDENILGRVLYTQSGHFLEWAELLLPIIASAMPDNIEARIVFYTRDQDKWLKSLYGQAVKRAGEKRGFKAWRDGRPLRTEWHYMRDRLASAACGIPVQFVSMEKDLAKFGFVGGELLEVSGIVRDRICALAIPTLQNKGLSPLALNVMRAINHLPLGRRRLLRISESVETWDAERRK